MKKLVIVIVIVIILLVGGTITYLKITDKTFGVALIPNEVTLIGSSSNFKSLPLEPVYADATTTNDVAHEDPGATLQQAFQTEGFDEVELNISVVGGTATSTLFVRQMSSPDGINYFDITTTSILLTSTSTALSFSPLGFNADPGTNSTTISVPFKVKGHRFTRFIIHGENISTDPNDGVQAWITLTKVAETAR